MTLVCRPTPFVRFIHKSRALLNTTDVSYGTIFERGSIFTSGPVPENPPKRFLVENVHSKNYLSLLAQGAKNGNCFPPAGSAAYIPGSNDRGLSPRFGKSPGDVAE
jgi:hypothetical protein